MLYEDDVTDAVCAELERRRWTIVQQLEFGGGVETQVADQAAYMGPVFLLDVGAVVFVAGPAPGERDLVGFAVLQHVNVDEL